MTLEEDHSFTPRPTRGSGLRILFHEIRDTTVRDWFICIWAGLVSICFFVRPVLVSFGGYLQLVSLSAILAFAWTE